VLCQTIRIIANDVDDAVDDAVDNAVDVVSNNARTFVFSSPQVRKT
jgi:hypothetical protein